MTTLTATARQWAINDAKAKLGDLTSRYAADTALAAAQAIYFRAKPEAMAARLEASARINEMIASAIQADARWF